MEVVLTGVASFSSGQDRAALRLRSATPHDDEKRDSTRKSTNRTDNGDEERNEMAKKQKPYSLVLVGETHHIAREFVHSIQYSGNADQIELAKNAIALKLVRSQRDKLTGLVTLIFDFVFCPSKPFM